ncbi:MAG: hypothetical protein KAJ12_04515 [Bacteroidetes bacterium]|nr:hypothetical protein [Bacteroidota bacterium]
MSFALTSGYEVEVYTPEPEGDAHITQRIPLFPGITHNAEGTAANNDGYALVSSGGTVIG